MFVDEVRVFVTSGRGGDGVTSFARQPYEPRGGPDGGDGGHGGSVVARADGSVATLVDYHHRPHRAAGRGRHGEGDRRRGADGPDEVLLVPPGTVVKDDADRVVADLAAEGDEAVLVSGGRGGRGNAAFKTQARRAPRFHERGEPGHQAAVVLELRLAADAALVGFPNAGKSSLVSCLSAARPKVADYPFTTLAPTLGVVRAGDVDFVVADVPGLVEGASRGRGLGHRFLRHVERAGVLVHVLDCASYEQRDPRRDLRVVLAELEAYQPELVTRPALVWLNKVDAASDTPAVVRPDLEAAGWEVLEGSAITGAGLEALRWRLSELVVKARRVAPPPRARDRPVLRPVAAEPDDFAVVRVDGGFRVTGARVERWVHMTDLDNEEAVQHLQDRLRRAGVEGALRRAGAGHGDAVHIAGLVFEFSPEEAPDGDRTAAR
ncbi:MAG: GTPase ObgE [Actinobacteria bacterium]|nr:GTPase ObgE [Actinomycetota bacterium]